MCGIAGGLHLKPEQLNQMLSALQHRGPDGSGRHLTDSFSIGMTRLAILDLKRGQQPFASSNRRIHAICNGELYNWKSLRKELEIKGHQFHTQCDTEILPAAWLEWGTSLPEKLNGMFALAIYDAKSNSLFLARDRCGQKPLYYHSCGSFSFASEIKALAAVGVPLTPNHRQLSTWLRLRYLPEPDTLFENIKTLPAAHWMTVDAHGKINTQRYWQPNIEDTVEAPRSLNELDRLTRSSVELALQSDVPVATYLSAGVDSSLLAYYIKDLGADVTTVSIGFGASSDETPHATEFAKSLGLPHHSTQLTPDALQDLPRVITQMDRPIGDALILAFDHLAKHTSELGCKVALGGEGPDEHYAGYSFHKAYIRAHQLGRGGHFLASQFLSHCPNFVLNKLAQFPANLGQKARQKVSRYFQDFSQLTPLQRRQNLHTLFEDSEIESLLTTEIFQQQTPQAGLPEPSSDQRLSSILASQYSSWLPDWSLIRQDKNTMAHSLEYRAPFLDHRIIDHAFTLPDSVKIHQGQDKYLWRQLAASKLSQEVTQRPKQPFYLPLEHSSWRTPLISMARDILTPESLTDHGLLQYKAIEPLFKSTEFIDLKQLASLTILQIWLNQQSSR